MQCLLCFEKGNNYKIVHERLRYSHKGKIYKCGKCDLTFLYPRLNELKQKQYYSEQYRDEYEEISIAQRFSNDMAEAKIRLERLKGIITENGNLLEIGSGSGAFLSLSGKYFKQVAGVELDVRAQTFLKEKGLNIYSDLDQVGEKKFDAIVMFHVLEHLLEPVDFIKKISKYLLNTGKLIIEVPNVDDALLSFYNIDAFKDFYYCSAHLSYFSSKTLEGCLKKANFSGEISFIQRYDLTNHLNWLKNKTPGGLSEQEKIFDPKTLQAYETDLRAKGLSDTLWGIFQKNE